MKEAGVRSRAFLRGGRGLLVAVLGLLLLPTGTAAASPRPGALDSGFGQAGRELLPLPPTNQPVGLLESPPWLAQKVASAAAGAGRTVVAGERTVMLLQRDGRLDRGFGHRGRVNLPLAGEGQTWIKDVAVNRAGRILVLAASLFPRGGGLTMVAKLLPDGRFDASFSNNGVLVTDFGLPAPQTSKPDATAPTDVLPEDLAIDGQGRLVVAGTTVGYIGYCRDAGEQPHHSVFLARLIPDGSLDTRFGRGGVVLDQGPSVYAEQHPYMGGVAIHRGAIYYATDQNDGANCEGYGGGLLARLDEAGNRDLSFGSAGFLGVTPPESRPRQITIDRRGRILVLRNASMQEREDSHRGWFDFLSRWNADGTLDTGFGRNGTVAVALPGELSSIDTFAVDSGNRPLLAGNASARFAVVRLTARGQRDRSFGKNGRILTHFPGLKAAATDTTIRGTKAIVAGPAVGSRLVSSQGFALARYRLGR